MRRVPGYAIWLGHAGDARDSAALGAAAIAAVVDLALEEPPGAGTREQIYCRFPLLDGPGNPAWLLKAAVETTACLIRSGAPTLVACGAGQSRAPCIAAHALGRIRGESPAAILIELAEAGLADVSPGLWAESVAALAGD
ncbi:MAG: protein tyrosine phosphatase [Isosphaeraceae bacterium]